MKSTDDKAKSPLEKMRNETMHPFASGHPDASPLERRRNETMGPFASGHPDASANDGRMQGQHRPRSDERKSSGCKICSKEHQVADCEKFQAMGLDERMDTCKRNYMCFKCLDDTTHHFAYCSFRTKCDACPSMSHHTLLHGIKRFQPLPNHVTPMPKSNPL
jgi:hypothetical protein